jgi:hypothetical protein
MATARGGASDRPWAGRAAGVGRSPPAGGRSRLPRAHVGRAPARDPGLAGQSRGGARPPGVGRRPARGNRAAGAWSVRRPGPVERTGVHPPAVVRRRCERRCHASSGRCWCAAPSGATCRLAPGRRPRLRTQVAAAGHRANGRRSGRWAVRGASNRRLTCDCDRLSSR